LVLIILAILLLILAVLLSLLLTIFWGASWSPTPMGTVRRMLEMARVKKGEKVYDLGSGDGRIALAASREFGARSVGIEINPLLHLIARVRRAASRVSEADVLLVRGNIFDVSLKDADVVAVYLSPWGNRRLRDKLERELRPGARVVTHKWRFEGWRPAEVDEKRGIWVYECGRW
jgi:SAM-dependent methyltransferase